MQFLIQTDKSNVPEHDFGYIVYKAIEYHREFNNRDELTCVTCSDIYNGTDSRHLPLPEGVVSPSAIKDFSKNDLIVPIGSIEFVQKFCDSLNLTLPAPINIPDDLVHHNFLKRKVFYENTLGFYRTVNEKDSKNYFFKDASVLKGSQGVIKDGGIIHTNNEKSASGLFLISEWIDIDSEYRVFVHKDQIIDIRRYSGNLGLFPDVDKILDMIWSYENSPVAYTLDVAITGEGDTVLIECHDFYSVGLYGFDNYNKVPFMFSQWWCQNMIQNQGNCN